MTRVEPVELRVDELLLRPWRTDDADAVYEACQDPVIRRWARGLPMPYPRELAVAFVGEQAPRALADGTALHLGVFAADGGRLLGSVGLRSVRADVGTAEIGYWSAPWARGRRVTERASRALLRHGFDTLGLNRVDWKATVGNYASRLTGERLGVRLVGVLAGEARRDGSRVDRWIGSLLPDQLTTAGADVEARARRHARVFGGDRPTLTGAGGVRLRPPEQRDVVGIAAACRDPDSVRWTMVPDPYTDEDAARFALGHAPAGWAGGTAAVFVVTGPDDAYAGTIDLRISPGDPAVADVGYLIAPDSRGRGWATAALRALAVWGLDELMLERIEWKAHVDNPASRRVAEKAGFTIEGVQRAGISHRGARRDCWVGSLLPGDLTTHPGQPTTRGEGAR